MRNAASEARTNRTVREWERRHQPQVGKYATPSTVEWVAFAMNGIPAASERDAVLTIGEGEEATEFTVPNGDEPAKARAPGSAQCLRYYLDKDGVAQPDYRLLASGEYGIEKITVYNWSLNPIAKDTIVLTSVRNGRHYVLNGECKKEDEEDDDDEDEFIIDGGEWT